MTVTFHGRRSIWWCWKMTPVAPHIANKVSYVTRINHESHFLRQAQYLVKLKCHFSGQGQHLVKFVKIAGAPMRHTSCFQ